MYTAYSTSTGFRFNTLSLLVQKANISAQHIITVTCKKTTDMKDTRVRKEIRELHKATLHHVF